MQEPTLTLEALGAWRALLGKLNGLGVALCGAIETDDLSGAIATMMEMRRTRAALARVETPLLSDGTATEQAAMRDMSRSVSEALLSEEIMRQWLARPLPPQAELLASPLGIAVLADSILPAVWDFEADLIILVGEALAPVAQLLIDVGQARVVIMGAKVPGAIEVAAVAEIPLALRSLPTPARQLVIHAAEAGPLVEDVRVAAEDAMADCRIHRNTMHSFSKTWLAQAFQNVPALAKSPSVCAYDGAFEGLPMVIVAPGPSLAKNAHLLAQLKGRAIITCFSHSLKPVLAAGVTPDLVVTVDPQDVRYHFEGCDVTDITFVNGSTVHPSLYELPARGFITMSNNVNADDWMFDAVGESPVVPGGGSVATSALSLALRWKCDPIIFVGLDLSFPNGQYYVSTSSDGECRAEVKDGVMHVAGWSKGFREMKAAGGPAAAKERCIELPGWHGDTVPSSFMFSMFHRWFEGEMAKGPASTVYNCTEGGCWIEGMTHRPLAEVAAGLTRAIDPAALLAAVASSPDRSARFTAYFREQAARLRRAKKLANRALNLMALGATGDRFTWLEKTLGDTLRPLGFVSMLALREVERAQDVAHREANEAAYLAASRELFHTLVRIIDEISPLIDSAISRISNAGDPAHVR
jgi:hypothetical protein